MIRYFTGEDAYGAREAIGELAKNEKARLNFWEVEAWDEATLAEKLERGGGGLFGKEMAVIREPSQLRKSLQENMIAADERKTSAEVILWEMDEPDARSLIFKHFCGRARFFPVLSARELEVWLVAEAKKRNVVFEVKAAAQLVARVGSDRWRLLSELEKLSLRGEKIMVQNVENEILEPYVEGEIFELLKQVAARKPAPAMQQLTALLSAGHSEFYILSMLAYQCRKLYVQQRTEKWLNNLTRVVATDFSIKQGKVDARTGVTMLVLSLLR